MSKPVPPASLTPPNIDVCAELDRFRQKLLDLSNTNRLLNYRKSATRTIQIVDEVPDQIFDRLVLKEKSFSFLALKESDEGIFNLPEDRQKILHTEVSHAHGNGDSNRFRDSTAYPARTSAKRSADDKLQTDLTEKKLDRILTTMRQEANAAVEETGVNYLYMAIGMLEWREQGSDRVFEAPLILVPVRFDRTFDGRSNKYRITVAYTGEEIQQNLCLAKRIENDFGLVMPDFSSDEVDEDTLQLPESYFSRVTEIIAVKPEWKIRREGLIGFFSFRKLLMYLDLDPSKWHGATSLAKHPLLRAVVEGSKIGDSASYFSRDYEIDEHPTAGNLMLVRDADSSQHSALCDIADKKSLVIEGPPGTGKSQTITNAIANALSEGKSVLFVAEKLAALDVVRSNLEKVGLGFFCLELHSEAANPREVFKDLGRRLDAHFENPRGLNSLRSRVETQKEKLKKYLLACALPAGPCSKPLYEIFWKIAELRLRGQQSLAGAKLDTNIEEIQFDESIACLTELAAHTKELGSPIESAWHGFAAIRLLPSGHKTVSDAIAKLQKCSQCMLEAATDLRSSFGGDLRSWILLADKLTEESLAALAMPHGVNRKLIPFLKDAAKCTLALSAAKAVSDSQNALRIAAKLVIGNRDAVLVAATELNGHIRPALQGDTGKLSLANAREIRSQLGTTIQAFQTFDLLSSRLKGLGFGETTTFRDFDASLHKYRLVSHGAVTPPRMIPELLFLTGALSAFQRGKRLGSTLDDQRVLLDEQFYFSKVPNDESLAEILDILEEFGNSWTRFFRSQYRKAKKRLELFAKPATRKYRNARWIEVLATLREFRQTSQRFVEDAELKGYFGAQFEGLSTNWDPIETDFNWINTAKKSGIGFQQAVVLIKSRWNSSNTLSPYDLIAAGKRLRQELSQWGVAWVAALNPNNLEAISLPDLRSYLEEMALLFDRILDVRRQFTAGDDSTIDKLCNDAAYFENAITYAENLRSNPEFNHAFPEHFFGSETDAVSFSTTAGWLLRLHELGLSGETIQRVSADVSDESSKQFAKAILQLKQLHQTWNANRATLAGFGFLDSAWLAIPGPVEDVTLTTYLQRLSNELPNLPPWSSMCRAIERCSAFGIKEFAESVYRGTLAASEAADCFDLTFHEQLAGEALEASESLSTFSRQSADQVRSEFQKLDRQLIELNQKSIAYSASQKFVPEGYSTGRVKDLTELGLIQHEVGKQRRHCRIRDLVQRAGRALQGLKPCFMMSPLSIAQYLPAGSLEFDLVVMDEASQIKPEDALGTIIRAKQLVVVGDPKQLPPTTFFDRMAEADEGEEATFLDETESILEVSLKAFPNRRRLRWHYRSQHESLIAFSNEKFYDGDLVVFPSPTFAAGRLGIRWHAVNGSTFVGGCNPVEANVVAEAILKHAQDHPDETLGVAAFNAKQAQAIRDRLDEITSKSSEARLALDRLDEHHDKLFVKNLENVQGDERDVIFISFTYGPDPATKVVMNRFGPMNSENGWRRLNVLVTRAKKRVEVFSSMNPSDIKGGVDRGRGVNAMKDYLHYAMTGQLVDRGAATSREPDSPFEIAVARVVERMGLKVQPQVGVAGYFIDLGILKPDSPGEFLLGIECDGATYHSSKSARDRDRLREEVITARGWKLHRIWSTDWFLNQESEEERLLAAIRRELGRKVP